MKKSKIKTYCSILSLSFSVNLFANNNVATFKKNFLYSLKINSKNYILGIDTNSLKDFWKLKNNLRNNNLSIGTANIIKPHEDSPNILLDENDQEVISILNLFSNDTTRIKILDIQEMSLSTQDGTHGWGK